MAKSFGKGHIFSFSFIGFVADGFYVESATSKIYSSLLFFFLCLCVLSAGSTQDRAFFSLSPQNY